MQIDFTKIENIVVSDIDMKDYPDFCDAYIEECDIDGVPATDEQLDAINENSDFVYEKTLEAIY